MLGLCVQNGFPKKLGRLVIFVDKEKVAIGQALQVWRQGDVALDARLCFLAKRRANP